MFTGIIQALGRLESIDVDAAGCRLEIDISALNGQNINLGDSIAVNGVCLTVVEYAQGCASFDVSVESLSKTCIENWKPGDELNLETALTLQTPLTCQIVWIFWKNWDKWTKTIILIRRLTGFSKP